VTSLIGDGQCVFKNCVVTLDPGNREMGENPLTLAVATLVDNGDVMKMKNQPGAVNLDPRLEFDNCFVRGAGDLLWSRVSRPLALDLTNSLVALRGNVLKVEAPDSATAPEAEKYVNVTIHHSTTYIEGNFLHLKVGKELKGLVPLHCKAKESLFVAAPTREALAFIFVDGPEMTDETLRVNLPWTSEQNVYAGYNTFIQQPMTEEMRPPTRDQMGWQKFTRDNNSSKFPAMVEFTTSPSDAPFVRMTPDMFKPTQAMAGADVQKTPRHDADR
jgi:hypothetical protein